VSTKIYNGYRLAPDTDLWEFTERLRSEGNPRRDALDLEVITAAAESVAARQATVDGKVTERSREAHLMGGYHAWDEAMRQLAESRLGDPHQLDVTFIRDPETNRILALLYAGSKIEEVFTGQPEVTEYGYWDNTDQPEDVTDEEWEERRVTWDRCLGYDPPVRRGVSFQLRGSATDGIVEMIYREREGIVMRTH
jgi:hypothetical protein